MAKHPFEFRAAGRREPGLLTATAGTRRRRQLVLICLWPVVAGCYSYAPVKVADLTPGMGVRARVSAQASDRIAPLLGATSARDLRGTLVSVGPDTLIVEVPAPGVPDPDAIGRVLNQRISLLRGEVLELETRSFDTWRTTAIVGATTVAAVVVLLKIMRGEPGSAPPPGGGGTESIVPLFHRSR